MKIKNSARRPTLKKMLQKRTVKHYEIKDTMFGEDLKSNKYYWSNMITARLNSEKEKEEE